MSLPSRGAWIEIPQMSQRFTFRIGRSPHGERGLKFLRLSRIKLISLVAPLTGSVD